jgi:hypothetical protein
MTKSELAKYFCEHYKLAKKRQVWVLPVPRSLLIDSGFFGAETSRVGQNYTYVLRYDQLIEENGYDGIQFDQRGDLVVAAGYLDDVKARDDQYLELYVACVVRQGRGCRVWSERCYLVTGYGITVTGRTEKEAINAWRKAFRKQNK